MRDAAASTSLKDQAASTSSALAQTLPSDAVLDALKMILGGAPLNEVLNTITHLIEAHSSGMLCSIFLLIGKRLIIHVFWMYYEEFLPQIRAALTEAAQVVASGRLILPVTSIYEPSQIKDAIEHYQRGGKVLLDFRSDN